MMLPNLNELFFQFRQNRAAVIGLFMVLLLILVALSAPVLAPSQPFALDYMPLSPPSVENWMGTDNMGRDILSGVVYGARISVMVGLLAASTSALIGVFLGAVSGFYGGKVDGFIMRATDTFMTIPGFFLAVLVVAFFGAKIWNVILVIGLLSWPSIARLVRAEFMKWKRMEFVDAARVLGMGNRELVFSEIMPNAVAPAVVVVTLQVGMAILVEASLSFVGLSDPNVMSWGYMLRNAQAYLRQAWWMALFPGMAVLMTVTAVNLVGDGINDAINPRSRRQ